MLSQKSYKSALAINRKYTSAQSCALLQPAGGLDRNIVAHNGSKTVEVHLLAYAVKT